MQICASSKRFRLPAILALALLSACGEQAVEGNAELIVRDPLVARELNGPLMVDPDLSWRSEAAAIISYRDGHPLPLFEAREDAAARAREAARLELLQDGQIPVLPRASVGSGNASFAELRWADEIAVASGVTDDCAGQLSSDLAWSTRLPETVSIMPHGMVQQAAGTTIGNCAVRVARYLTPASDEDVLEYHFAKADRARFRLERISEPEAQLVGERRDQAFAIHLRNGPGGMTEVDIVHWRR